MQITETCGGNGSPETILVGRLMDQAADALALERLTQRYQILEGDS